MLHISGRPQTQKGVRWFAVVFPLAGRFQRRVRGPQRSSTIRVRFQRLSDVISGLHILSHLVSVMQDEKRRIKTMQQKEAAGDVHALNKTKESQSAAFADVTMRHYGVSWCIMVYRFTCYHMISYAIS